MLFLLIGWVWTSALPFQLCVQTNKQIQVHTPPSSFWGWRAWPERRLLDPCSQEHTQWPLTLASVQFCRGTKGHGDLAGNIYCHCLPQEWTGIHPFFHLWGWTNWWRVRFCWLPNVGTAPSPPLLSCSSLVSLLPCSLQMSWALLDPVYLKTS